MKTLPSFLLLVTVTLVFSHDGLFLRSAGRPLQTGSTNDELVSDGSYNPGIIQMMSGGKEHEKEPYVCEQMYGFLPCSENIAGHVFLIMVYEYLLFHGEFYVAAGGERIFKMLGPGVFGACAFQLIGSLPEALILLASGLLDSEEAAQECVLTGVGLLAGTSILLLTLLWGTCVFLSSQQYSNYLDLHPSSSLESTYNPLEKFFLSRHWSYGTVTDTWASYMANIMLISVIPFLIIQVPSAFHLSFQWERIFVIIALVVSVFFLISYLFYQLFQPWIQRRQLLYLKHEHLVVDILKHLQKHSMGQLFKDDGSPNLSVLKQLFKETDQDGDKTISASEVKEFIREIKFQRLYSDKDQMTEDIMKDFDINHDQRITLDEFVKGMGKWIEQTKKDSGKKYHLDEVIRPWIEKRREERELMKNLVPEILERVASSHGSLLTENGSADVTAIKRLFKNIDLDNNDFISASELKELLMNVKYGTAPEDTDVAAATLMEQLDITGKQLITEDEFVTGLSKWLNTTRVNQPVASEARKNSGYQTSWEETDKFVEDKFIDKSFFAWVKALSLVVIGITMLGLLAEPLIRSVQRLSKAANISSFFIAFIFVPFATNARISISAIRESCSKKLKINSLTFSEIYGTVLMNNLMGFLVLLALVYFRNLTWEFSMEVLVVLIVSAVMGCLASFSTIFPLWTSFFAFLLYPLSLVLVSLLGGSNWLT